MSESKYERQLREVSGCLDLITHSDGTILQLVESIINQQDRASLIKLCKHLENTSSLKDEKITKIAISVKDCLIQYYGYLQVVKECTSDDNIIEKDLTLEEILMQLNQLVGLSKVKSKVNELIAFQKVQQLRRNVGLHSPKGTMHLAFIGNPGTGKTSVARIVGRVYKKIGLLSKGHFIEVSRTNLIAGYQGQTALKVKGVIEKAKGGVLFIDEAYSLTENDHADSYGRECLTELTKALEDYRDDLVVIVAGYRKPMEQFFDANPGLRSRFNTFIEFDDYSKEELIEILKKICKDEEYNLSHQLEQKLSVLFSEITESKDENFSNGRYVRNLFDEMVLNHAIRLAEIDNPTRDQLQLLSELDYK